jgi:protease YdgD
MKRCNGKTLVMTSLAAIAGLSLSSLGTSEMQAEPRLQVKPPAKSISGLKTTAGFIPANLERSRFPRSGRNIFGKDDRILMNSAKYPWSAIGRVEALNGKTIDWTCTGTLIGKSLVVTNAHCVVDEKKQQITTNKIQFRPNLINGEAPAVAVATRVIPGTTQPNRDRGNDWAFLVLDRPLGETYGWLKVAIADFSDLESAKEAINLAGYSSDFPTEKPSETAGVHQGCSIRGFASQPGVITHDCDMMAGASGGPMFAFAPDGSAIIVALNSAHRTSPDQRQGSKVERFSGDRANLGVYAITWADKAQELLKTQR